MNLLQRYRRLSIWNKLAVWGAIASIAGIVFSVSAYFGGTVGNETAPTSMQITLAGYLKELESIENNWAEDYELVEAVAGRAAAVLEEQYPRNSEHIRATLDSSLESREVLRSLRQDIKEVQDQINVENSNN